MSVAIAKWTLDDYHRMIEVGLLEGRSVELLNGEIIEMSPEGEPHAYYRTEAKDYLAVLLGDRVKIREGAPITIPSSDSEPEPDLAIVQPLGREYLRHHPYPDNIFWLIEFSNTSLAKDLDSKRKTYAIAGIREYWVMNLAKHQLHVFRHPVNGDYSSEVVLTDGDIQPLAFPDVTISVMRLLED
ncbi:Uma2 family endonuclease [Oscillatoria sp. FACHB-1407]|uniref:Uma2 family endonuclease n=1 Tax=Oscillatoria sp. FACHB-1407 TaxID=2692847 RepID=UPI0016847921|nr:Uma2 family endonuclease [Oscillatoria sp. FACHB-1407]MBD2461745.1 Uma2 family endonuclease [Oscillatoria sp. FACHB-1407]